VIATTALASGSHGNEAVRQQAARYAAWLVDLDGTLYRQRPVRLAMAAELCLLGPHRLRIIRRFRQEQERIRLEGAAAAGTCPYRLQLQRTAEAVGTTFDAVAETIAEWMERRPCKWLRLFCRHRLLSEITAFRAAGGKTALVSDYPARTKLAGLGALELFDEIVASGEPGGPLCLKPSPEGYLLAAERLGVSPAQCLVVGDRLDADGEAARRAQMSYRQVG
jgi:HAD superfamily hydrolase (TIGR01549 family)